MVIAERNERRDSILTKNKPKFSIGKVIKFKDGSKREILNIYPKELQDINLGELERMGYESPKIFIDNWIKVNKTFNSEQVVWIIEFKI